MNYRNHKNRIQYRTDRDAFLVMYNDIMGRLSLSQYESIMGGDMSYTSKLTRVKAVTKSKLIHTAIDHALNFYNTQVCLGPKI